MSDSELNDLKGKLAQDPGDPCFLEYAKQLLKNGSLAESILVLLRGLSLNGSEHNARLLLARSFAENGMLPFAIRELEELCTQLPDNKPLRKLLERLAPDRSAGHQKDMGRSTVASSGSTERTVAEAEFDLGELDLG